MINLAALPVLSVVLMASLGLNLHRRRTVLRPAE
jgi:hypothetical protein